MKEQQFKELVFGFLNKTLNKSEEEELLGLLQNESYKNLFNEYIELEFLLAANFYEKHPIQQTLGRPIPIRSRKRGWLKFAVSSAAVILLLFGVSILMKVGEAKSALDNIQVDKKNITIKLPNGSVHSIQVDDDFVLKDSIGKTIAKTQKDVLVFSDQHTGMTSQDEKDRQVINVPYGQSLSIQLPDSSLVHMNAGSKLEFPVSFKNHSLREVIAYGEMYFEVIPNGKRFITHIGDMRIEVLGTSYNVNSYAEDHVPTVVLVEGKVALRRGGQKESLELAANELGTYSKEEGRLIKRKVNTRLYTSWMQGELVFREESFTNILRKLERHYAINLTSEDEHLNAQVFNASFKSGESIENVLRYFKEIYDIEYQVKKDEIIITNP